MRQYMMSKKRCKRKLSIDEIEWCESLLQDAAIIVDTYGKNAIKRGKTARILQYGGAYNMQWK